MHRRVGESELENALMREVTEVAGKGPGAGSRRLGDREKTPLSDRLRPAHPPDSMIRLPAIAPGGYHYRHAKAGRDKCAGLRAEVAVFRQIEVDVFGT